MLTEHSHERFEVVTFVSVNTLTILLLFAFIKIFFPNVWSAQLTASWQVFTVTMLATHLVMGFVEFFFHRYILHMNVIPFCSHFYTQHNLHHGLTDVVRDTPYVTNEYPIEENIQLEASFFPWYTFLLFALLFTPFLAIIQVYVPTLPMFLAGYSGLLLSIVLYESIHNTWHMPLSTWQRLFGRKYTGRLWKFIYAFHLRHHANVSCNEGISGFLGIPLPDLLFGTYVQAQTLYPHKHFVESKEFAPPRPIFFIRWLDAALLSLSKKR